MLDFVKIVVTENKSRKTFVVEPNFIYTDKSDDLMIRGHEFYAVWDEENQIWSRKLTRVYSLVDKEVLDYISKAGPEAEKEGRVLTAKLMSNSKTGLMDDFARYLKRSVDQWQPLNQKPIFSDCVIKREDYATFRLPYSINVPDLDPDHPYNKMMDTWFSPGERRKLEWSVGCIFCGDVADTQKFVAMYGPPRSGKGSFLQILHSLLDGYISEIDAAALSTRGNQFAMDAFINDPIVGIQADADMSRITDNTKFNTIVSHEPMRVNEKFKNSYTKAINAFIFVGTNYPIKITEARSGLGRRLLDVTPTGDRVPRDIFDSSMSAINHSLGAIAKHCMNVYRDCGRTYYDGYTPVKMFGLTNDVYSFVSDNYFIFSDEPYISLEFAWARWKDYLENTNGDSSLKRRELGNELQYYFKEYKERFIDEEGRRIRKVYLNFKKEMFDGSDDDDMEPSKPAVPYFLRLKHQESILDSVLSESPAQYANERGNPKFKWANVDTILNDIDTQRLHYILVPENHIVIDFDIKGDDGKKSLEKNIEAAMKWPPTYAETSKSGEGLHLHYIYAGDTSKLANRYSEDIEIKVFNGNASLRRKVGLCNDVEVATISSGLPLKGGDNVVNFEAVKSEKGLRIFIGNCLNKKHHGATAPEVNFIFDKLKETYESGLKYDVSDMYSDIIQFAASSTNQSDKCIKMAKEMKPFLKSDEPSESVESNSDVLIFFDTEVFPNLLLINWKARGEGKKVVRMINPSPAEVADLMKMRLVGFNCRRYDNHILYARMMGYTNQEIFNLSNDIINKHTGFFGEAYNVSYTDVYDFAAKKQSLKKWEIELGIHHLELGIPWDKPVDESLWQTVAEYCDNDVIATEAVFDHLAGDFTAREILAKLAGMSVNTTTNTLTTRIIFGNNKKPNLNYRFLGEKPSGKSFTYEDVIPFARGKAKKPQGKPWFPGYIFDNGKSIYRGEEIGEGGRVYAEPGMYFDVDDEDVSSMHPHSAIEESYFGKEGTKRFKDLVDARVSIKHGDYDSVRKMFDGRLSEYLTDPGTAKALAQALKIAINSVYGLTSAKFDNPFHDNRNVDNIVAKRGALFMTDLKNAVQGEGYTVVHIKTDSIKVANADDYIQKFIRRFGEAYGYEFETEAIFDRICLVNDAVYIARVKGGNWTATGAQFAVPYVFKTLFTHEPIEFEDMCETKAVQTALYLDMNEGLAEGEHDYHFIGKVGLFCPIKQGCGGGILYREKDGKYYAATGTKGYRWLESEMVKDSRKERDIDNTYYEKLVKDARDTISNFGDFGEFTAE